MNWKRVGQIALRVTGLEQFASIYQGDWVFGGGGDFFSTATQPLSWARTSGWNPVGLAVTLNSAGGIPAVAHVIRLLAETTGIVPLQIFKGREPDVTLAHDSWQWFRLCEQPNDEQSALDFQQDIETSIESQGGAFVWKAKARPRPQSEADIQLFVMDPGLVKPFRPSTENVGQDGIEVGDVGRKLFKVREGNNERVYRSDQILHIRGWHLQPGAIYNLSPIGLHRLSLSGALAMDDFASGFFLNDGRAPFAITVPATTMGPPMTRERADEMADNYVERHTGRYRNRPPVFYGGSGVANLGLSQTDAQFVQQKQLSIEDICRIFHVSTFELVRQGLRGSMPTDDDFRRFMSIDLAPRLVRIEQAFRRDTDLFPLGADMFPRFNMDAVLRPDVQQRAASAKDWLQAGIKEANEVRAEEGLPIHPQGGGLQRTPVGGAPNPDGQVSAPTG